jgi:hypothetical protein
MGSFIGWETQESMLIECKYIMIPFFLGMDMARMPLNVELT